MPFQYVCVLMNRATLGPRLPYIEEQRNSSMTTSDPADGRFTGRAENYARFRPGYPDAVIALLRAQAGWSENAAVADVGAGTGISSELFLRHGNRVWAVEPNAEMRAAAESLRDRYPCLEVVPGTAESTGLPDACADFVVAATAFHWFDANACHIEFSRIAKPHGQVVLMWNKRQTESPFLSEYERLLMRFGTDYKERWGGQRQGVPGIAARFFGEGNYSTASMPNLQRLDREGLAGRLLSSSYAPLPGHPNHEPMFKALSELFDRFAKDGVVTMEYETVVCWGRR
jgi:SAM-dependent methyltransferase